MSSAHLLLYIYVATLRRQKICFSLPSLFHCRDSIKVFVCWRASATQHNPFCSVICWQVRVCVCGGWGCWVNAKLFTLIKNPGDHKADRRKIISVPAQTKSSRQIWFFVAANKLSSCSPPPSNRRMKEQRSSFLMRLH